MGSFFNAHPSVYGLKHILMDGSFTVSLLNLPYVLKVLSGIFFTIKNVFELN